MAQCHGLSFVMSPGYELYLSRNRNEDVYQQDVERSRVDIYGTARKGLITLYVINDSKCYPWFTSLETSYAKFCCGCPTFDT